jgi:hypothetical protein
MSKNALKLAAVPTLAAAGLFVAAMLAGSGSAAAPSTGAVVAKNLTRHTVITASTGGLVRTLHVGTPSRFQIGQVISLSRHTVVGHASRAEIRGTLVRHTAGVYVVSAGGSVFSVPSAAARHTAGVAKLKPGDKIDMSVSLAGGKTTATGVKDDGEGDDETTTATTTTTSTTSSTTTTTPTTTTCDDQGDDDSQGDEQDGQCGQTTTTTTTTTTDDNNDDQGDDNNDQ